MSEILNLRTLCRCCHRDGSFKSLQVYYVIENEVEVYSTMLRETFDISMTIPPVDGSNSICDVCIQRLRDAAEFKQQVLLCEKKFHEYCTNEQSLLVKEEITYNYDEPDESIEVDVNVERDCDEDQKCDLEIRVEVEDNSKQSIPVGNNPEDTKVKESTKMLQKKIKRVRDCDEDQQCHLETVEDVPDDNDLNRDFDDNSGLDEPCNDIVPPNDDNSIKNNKKLPKKRGRPKKIVRGRPKTSTLSRSQQIKEAAARYRQKIREKGQKQDEKNNLKEKDTIIDNNVHDFDDPELDTNGNDDTITNNERIGNRITLDPETETWIKTDKGYLYKCKLCGVAYKALARLRRHLHETHKVSFKCSHCDQIFFNRSKYLLHLNQHSIKTYTCRYCPKTYDRFYLFKAHENSHTKKNRFQCDICKKFYACKSSLRIHVLGHYDRRKKHVCDYCGHVFHNFTYFRMHVASVHQKLRMFKCKLCPKTFTANKSLKEHIRDHTGERPYSCDRCTSTFKTSVLLRTHKRLCGLETQLSHDTGPKRYTCKICLLEIGTLGQLRSHMIRNHTGDKEHKCHICVKEFISKYALKRHIDEHNGIKYSCDICNINFAKYEQMRRHKSCFHAPNRKTEKDRQKIQCHMCGLYFKEIEKHMAVHKRKPFACQLCNKTFLNPVALNKHIKHSHDRIKFHACNMCDKKYCHKTGLDRHIVKVHK